MTNIESQNKKIILNKTLVDPSNQKEVKELVFQDLVVSDFLKYSQTEFVKVDFVIEMLVKLTGYPKSMFNNMSAKDYLECSMVINSFFGYVQEN